MNSKKLEELIREAVGDADLRAEEIPSLDLYLDQITSLATQKRQEGSPRFYDRVLTKTMVNNYSKDGLIRPIKGKKYSREHIMQMLLVYDMKNTLSIGEIDHVLKHLYASPGYDARMMETVYRRYLETKERERQQIADVVGAYVAENGFDVENEEDFLVLLLGLSNLSSYLKNVVQALLEEQYLKTSQKAKKDKDKDKEKEKESKKEKKAKKETSREAARTAPEEPSDAAESREGDV
jgi:hypothetical protein